MYIEMVVSTSQMGKVAHSWDTRPSITQQDLQTQHYYLIWCLRHWKTQFLGYYFLPLSDNLIQYI